MKQDKPKWSPRVDADDYSDFRMHFETCWSCTTDKACELGETLKEKR